MVGEIRDPEAATIACRAAKNGPMILAGFQAGETLIALFGLLELGVDPSLLASGLSAILARGSCDCSATLQGTHKPSPSSSGRPIPGGQVDVFYRRPRAPQGACAVRRHWDLRPDRDLRTAGRHGADAQDDPPRSRVAPIKAEARKNGLIYIQEDGLRQVILGRTSIEELLRIKEGAP